MEEKKPAKHKEESGHFLTSILGNATFLEKLTTTAMKSFIKLTTSHDPKQWKLVGEALQLVGRTIEHRAEAELKENERLAKEEAQKRAREEQQLRYQKQCDQLKHFLMLAQEVIREVPSHRQAAKPRYDVTTMLPKDHLTKGEIAYAEERKAEEARLQQEKHTIQSKYKLVQEKPVKVHYINLRKWWIDHNMPLNKEQHPDFQWLQEIGRLPEFKTLFEGIYCPVSSFSGMDLTDFSLEKSDLRASNFAQSNVSNVKVAGAHLAEIDLTNALMTEVKEEKPVTYAPEEIAKQLEAKGAYITKFYVASNMATLPKVFGNIPKTQVTEDSEKFCLIEGETEIEVAVPLDNKKNTATFLSNALMREGYEQPRPQYLAEALGPSRTAKEQGWEMKQ